MTISIAIAARNAADDLEGCLRSAQFADEIVVLLDRSEDHSESIAQRFNAKIIKGAWPQEGKRRNTLLSHCTSNWILELDTDERISLNLQMELNQIRSEVATQAHMVNLDNYIGKRLVRHGWGPTCFGIPGKVSLFPRGSKHYDEETIDAHPPYRLQCPVGPTLEHPIIHYRERNISEVWQRLDRYTTLRANEWLQHPEKMGPLRSQIRRFFSYFYKSYVRRKGYKEGHYGLLIALCAGLYYLLAYIKVKAHADMITHNKERECASG